MQCVSDDGLPLEGVTIQLDSATLGTSGESGIIRANVEGTEGQVVALRAVCPQGYQAENEAFTFVLRRHSDNRRLPQYEIRCRPLLRSMVVAVRARNGPNLPVRYLGQQIATTDAHGAAHVLLKSHAQDTVELMLDTEQHPRLRPRNPTERFRVGSTDEWVVLDLAFKVKPVRARAPPRRIINLRAR